MRIAVVQLPGARLADWRATLALIVAQVERAAVGGAELVVLPECAWPAYFLGSPEAYYAARAAGLPAPAEFLDRMRTLARTCRMTVCVGHVAELEKEAAGAVLAESASGQGRTLGAAPALANAATLIAADGRLLGTRHKCFLWDFDHDCFAPGDRLEPIDTDFGRVGVMICADARLPEIPATLIARGARLLLQPTAWVNTGTPEIPYNPQPDFLIAARAAEFGVPAASASKAGVEGPTRFVGRSLLVTASGEVVGRCGDGAPDLAVADIDLPTRTVWALPPAEARALLAGKAPIAPRADVPGLILWPGSVPAADCGHQLGADPGEPVLSFAAPDQTGLPDETGGESIGASSFAEGTGGARLRGDRDAYLALTAPSPEPAELAGIRVAGLSDEAARRFAPARRFALDGAHVLVVFGGAVRPELVRARACENRVYLIWVRSDGWSVFDPTGRSVAEASWRAAVMLRVEPSRAASKCVAPRTDIHAGRRVALYHF